MLRRDLEIFCLGTAIIAVFRGEGGLNFGHSISTSPPLEGRLDNENCTSVQAGSRLTRLDILKFSQYGERLIAKRRLPDFV